MPDNQIVTQRELPLAFPELAPDAPLIPLRMVNEYVYCPRLAYLMWVQAEWADSADTVEGRIKHKRVDAKADALPEAPAEDEHIHARSVSLSSSILGITAKLDLVEGEGTTVTPVDYKRGKRPTWKKAPTTRSASSPAPRACCCENRAMNAIPACSTSLNRNKKYASCSTKASSTRLSPPLADSPKCPRCSLAGICLPDEVRFLNEAPIAPRPLFAQVQLSSPLYVQSPRAWLRKDEERIIIDAPGRRTQTQTSGHHPALDQNHLSDGF